MAFNPGVYDRSGEIRGAGMLGAMQIISQGMGQVKQVREENKKLDAENKALELLTKSTAGKVGLPPELVEQLTVSNGDESPRAKNARLKTALTGVLSQAQLDEEQAKRALINAQVAQIGAAQSRDSRNEAAARAAVAARPVTLPDPSAVGGAFNSGTPIPAATGGDVPEGDEMMRRYLAAGGNDPRHAEMLVAAAKPKKQDRRLETITLKDEQGNPVNFAWDGASAPQRIGREARETKPLSGPGKLLQDAKTLEAAGDATSAKLLRDIASKQAEDKPMDITAFVISGGKPEEYRDYVSQFRAARGGANGAPAPAGPANLQGADKAAYEWAKANPKDRRSAEILKRLGVN